MLNVSENGGELERARVGRGQGLRLTLGQTRINIIIIII